MPLILLFDIHDRRDACIIHFSCLFSRLKSHGFMDYKYILMAHVQFFMYRYPPKSFSEELLSIHSSPSLYWYQTLPWHRSGTLHWTLLAFMTFTSSNFSSLSEFFCVDTFPLEHQLRLSAWCHLQTCFLIPLSMSLITVNSTGPSTDPWGG